MDREAAETIIEIFLKASSLCENSLRVVKADESLGDVTIFGRLVGAFMGYSYTNVLAPLWKIFPDLEPPEMKERYVEPEPVLSPASQVAIRTFLAQAYAALRLIQDVVPPADRGMFSCGGLPEVESAVVAIERFLATPRRDEASQA